MNFPEGIIKKIKQSQYNSYSSENWDHYRFGKIIQRKVSFINRLKLGMKKFLRFSRNVELSDYKLIRENLSGLEWLHNHLNDIDKAILIELIAYRVLGYRKVKLSLNTREYWEQLEKIDALCNKNDFIDTGFLDFKLYRIGLDILGYNSQIYFTPQGILTDFIIEQYAYKKSDVTVQAVNGDYVIDAGACWGDTAIYFANKVGETGKVYSFEFIPKNLKIFKRNLSINPNLSEIIEIVEKPLADESGNSYYFVDNGPASTVSAEPFNGYFGMVDSLSIDDFVLSNNIERIDFIKMDIEGAEPAALRGAINTIRKYKPKLAIAIYHSMNDFVNIPRWIYDLNLGYKLYLGHYKIHAEETIIFATTE